MTLLADVVFPLPLEKSFTYAVPAKEAGAAKPGVRVLAPFGRKVLLGFIVEIYDATPSDECALKSIHQVLDEEPVISPRGLAFSDRLRAYYHSSWGEFLAAMAPPSSKGRTAARIRLTEKGLDAQRRNLMTDSETKAAGILGTKAYGLFHLRRISGEKNIAALLARMERKGLVEFREDAKKKAARKKKDDPVPRPSQLELDFSAGSGQEKPLKPLFQTLASNRFASFLLFGEKEERWTAYVSLIREALARSKQTLFLVPELEASERAKEILEPRFGRSVVLQHGQVAESARGLAWPRIKSGAYSVVIGPRSALFAPVDHAGLVIVDEEQDDAYELMEGHDYDARVGARLKAMSSDALLVFGSSIPTVEAFYLAQRDGHRIALPGPAPRKNVIIADDRAERSLITAEVRKGLQRGLEFCRPSLVFLNRRGYASFLFCPRCGFIPKCDRCHLSLAYSKKDEALVCRLCRSSRPKIKACPECGSPVLEPRGPGVEAVEEELLRSFPNARISVFDGERPKSKGAKELLLRKFREGRIDILLGTQGLAHQTGIPAASFVAILNPETLLGFADFRVSQKTFQSVERMMRFGASAAAGGEIIIQTSFPSHHSLQAAARQEYPLFYDREIRFRRLLHYPPFSAMAEIIFFGRDGRALGRKARELIRRMRLCGRDVQILGPAFVPPSWARHERGIQVIFVSDKSEVLDACLDMSLAALGGKKKVLRFG
jgi:primosomal protein N' (replication factor Y)